MTLTVEQRTIAESEKVVPQTELVPESAGEANGEKRSHLDMTAAEAFMCSAACSARAGVRIGHGGPFGAAVVRDGIIISCAHNMVLHCCDPTRHAEMNAISQACQALGSHDLSDCDLYTTCEPCPMCWGAVQWSRLGKVHIGVDRHTAAKYGFDDKVFYDEIDGKAGCYGLQRCGYYKDTSGELQREAERVTKNMVEIFDGICHSEVAALFADPAMNRTLRRRFTAKEIRGSVSGTALAESHQPQRKLSDDSADTESTAADSEDNGAKEVHEKFMKKAIDAAKVGVKLGRSKEREPFGAVIVKNGEVIAEGHNSVLESRDATATAEVNCIRAASAKLGTHNLEGCDMYTTTHPDLMSLGAVLWARLDRVFCGVTQQLAAQAGFEEGLLHLKDLMQEQGGSRIAEVLKGVALEDCEQVFREWSDRNGVIY